MWECWWLMDRLFTVRAKRLWRLSETGFYAQAQAGESQARESGCDVVWLPGPGVFVLGEARRFVLLGVEGNSPFVCCPTQRPHGSRPRHSGNTQGPAGVLWDGLGNRVFQGTDLRRGSEGQTPTVGSNPSSDRQFRVGMDPILRSICDPASCASQNIAIGASSGHRWREP